MFVRFVRLFYVNMVLVIRLDRLVSSPNIQSALQMQGVLRCMGEDGSALRCSTDPGSIVQIVVPSLCEE